MRRLFFAAGLTLLAQLAPPTALAQDGGVGDAPASEVRVPREASDAGAPPRAHAGEDAPATPPPAPPPPAPRPPAAPRPEPALDGGVPLPDGGASFFDGGAPDGSAPGELERLDGGLFDPALADDLRDDAGAAASIADAGPPPAEAEAEAEAEPAEDPSRNIFLVWTGWMWERSAERESAARESAERRAVADSPPPPAGFGGIDVVLTERIDEWLGLTLPDRRISVIGLVVLLVVALIGLSLVARARRPLPARGFVPRLLGAVRLLLRLVVVLAILLLASRLLPDWLRPAIVLTLAAGALALGFGAMWVLLPDVIGCVVLLTEGRLKRGQWIAGEGFAGRVEQVGPRVTLLRAHDGALLSIPNRRVVRSPLSASRRPWHEVDVELEAPAGESAQRLREAIGEAVLCSPYVPPDPGLSLARDPREPHRWRVRVRLIDGRFADAFEGQLLERVEEALARSAPADPPPP